MDAYDEPIPSRASRRAPGPAGPRPASNNDKARWAIIAAVVVMLLVAAFLGTAFYTDQPSFCATCHEMRPYVSAWAGGAHKDVWCVECHVSRGYGPRLLHKFAALQEVVAHFRGDTAFPRPVVPDVPSRNCSACHATVVVKDAPQGFDHAMHATRGTCQQCHATSGHSVSDAALQAAGIFAAGVTRVRLTTGIVTVDHGSADLPGHVTVLCTRCHDLAKTGCQACHQPPHKPRGDCSQCHKPGTVWRFTHPTEANCQLCHELPATHFKPASGVLPACTTCHTQPGQAWTFTHPTLRADCSQCHAVPAKHFQPAKRTLKPCSDCHRRPGKSWAFTHPGSTADCASCHTPPSGHPTGQCSQCHHKPGVSFAFTHPSFSSPHGVGIANGDCTKCHQTADYSQHYCTCHNDNR